MESFDELELDGELIDLLSGHGFEHPTPFQEQALPVVRRGNNLVGRAGPGAGVLLAWGVGLLERLGSDGTADGEGPRALVLAATAAGAVRMAESLASLAVPTGLAVGAVSGHWVLPERADILFGTPGEVLGWLREGRTSLSELRAVVVDQPTALASLDGLDELETLFEFLDDDVQRIVIDLPIPKLARSPAAERVADFVKRHVRRSVTVPPRSTEGEASSPERGHLAYRIVEEPEDEAGLRLVGEILEEGDIRHLAVFFRDEYRAADFGDQLSLHGYGVGAPGDESVPVWLGVDELETRRVLDSMDRDGSIGVLSWDVPVGPDSLDRRHGAGRGGWVMILSRETAHLRAVARQTGYTLEPAPPPPEERVPDDLVATVDRLEAALEEEDVAAYMLVLETLFEEHDPAEVAAAAVALLRKRPAAVPATAAATAGAGSSAGERREKPSGGGTPAGARGPAWVRLFVSLGHKDRAGPGDIVGAITGETSVDGSKIGRIEIRDTFSVVEVQEEAAEQVIRGLNGTTVKGRSVRVDYDRGGRREGRSRRR